MFDKLTEKLESFLDMGIPGYDCIVKHHGETVYRRWNGCSDKETGRKMTGDELYYVYSCSKIITCTAAMQLYEKGLFSLDEPLWHYLPEAKFMAVKSDGGIVPAKNTIKIANLFSMTAGLNYDRNSKGIKDVAAATNGRCPTREIVRGILSEPLDYEPGMKWQYSLAHDVLAALVEVISGQLFNDYVTKNIFQPLGMKNTTYILTPELQKRIATLYWYYPETKSFEVYPNNFYILGPEYASGGAGCISTVEDMSLFLEALRKGDSILKKETIALMATDRLDDTTRPYFWRPNYGYGLGVRCPNKALSDVTDFGWGGAAGAWLAIDCVNDYTAYYAQHVLNSPNAAMRNDLPPLINAGLA